MSKKDLELLNIEVGTFKRVNDKLTLKIDQSQFRYDSLAELNEVKVQEPNFLHLQNIVEQDSQVVLTYGLSKEAKSLKHLPTEKKAIRTAIAKQIMTQDVLSDGKYHISLNPANIWYYPMTNVWYAYRANELMPFDDKFNSLSKYKALVLYCLTGTPYERLLSEPKEALAKNQDELLQQIVNANDTEELKFAIKGIDDYVSYREWQDIDNKEQKSKKKLWITAGSIAIVAIVGMGLVHKNDQKKYVALENQHQEQITKLKYSTAVKTALDDKEWKEAGKAMDKAGYSKNKKAMTYLNLNKYQEALNTDPSLLLKIVKKAYKNDDTKDILEWQTPSSTSSKVSDQLKLEKAIINYDVDTLTGQLSFEQNGDVLLKMGKAFNDHNDTQDASTAQTKLVAINKNKGDYLKALMTLKSANKSVDDNQKKLDDANKIDDKDNSKGDKVKEAKSNLENAKKDQSTAQKKVDQLQKKVGD